jgi:hypothetical protein
MKDLPDILRKRVYSGSDVYQPVCLRVHEALDAEKLLALLMGNAPTVLVYDQIWSQLQELVKLRHPRERLSAESIVEKISALLGTTPIEAYGVWVYYPWSSRLVHMLDEKEFIEVRTNRNQYKITKKERDILGSRKIGVIGLSVGKTIAVAMAMERSFGEIRLADFDRLELSNLNRIQTGMHNLNVYKAIAVAREISEIDPFLKTICYTEGLTEANMDDFFLRDGKLDILVEECDGLDIKILCRQKAKSLKIPVVMEMNDRGTLDVERFDLEPERPLLHGLIDHLDISRIKDLSNEEKVPFILPMLGAETISSKLKASMIEVGQSISTWPQLASSVVLGGAMVADVCRRISLKQFNESGRYFVDFHELVSDQRASQISKAENEPTKLTEAHMLLTIDSLPISKDNQQIEVPPEILNDIIDLAVKAPSAENMQPWKWMYSDKTLFLFADLERPKSFLDRHMTAVKIALGAASENCVLAAHARGFEIKTEQAPENRGSCVALFRFYKDPSLGLLSGTEIHRYDNLANQVSLRLTNRKVRTCNTIPEAALVAIKEAGESIPGAKVIFLKTTSELQEAKKILSAFERIRFMHTEENNYLISTLRWTATEALKFKDGIDIQSLELSPSEKAELKMVRTPEVLQHLKDWEGGRAFEKPLKRLIDKSGAIGLICLPDDSSISALKGGRLVQRLWLTASDTKIHLQPLQAAPLLLGCLREKILPGFSNTTQDELYLLQDAFDKLFCLKQNSTAFFLFRLDMGEPGKSRSLRHPTKEVFFINCR